MFSFQLCVFAFILSLTTFHFAQASDDGVSFTIHHQYESARALGMGDAFVAVANDYSAIFYNPAGLARRTDGEVNLSLDVAGSTSFQKFSKDLEDAQHTGTTDAEKTGCGFWEFLDKTYGKNFFLCAPLLLLEFGCDRVGDLR